MCKHCAGNSSSVYTLYQQSPCARTALAKIDVVWCDRAIKGSQHSEGVGPQQSFIYMRTVSYTN